MDDGLLEKLAELGFDPEMGARPLRRVIQQKVEDTLSDKLLIGEFQDGDLILVDLEGEDVVLRVGQTEPGFAPPEEAVAAA